MVVNELTTAPPLSANRAAVVPSPLRRTIPPVVVIVGYLIVGLVAFWPPIPSGHLFGAGGDFIQSLWFLAWVPHALAHGLNPFFSNAIYVPTGVNLAQNTGSPLLALVSTPFAAVFSPIVRADLLLVLAMPVSATAAFVVLRKWRVWSPAAALGGLVYGFSPYMVGQGASHLPFVFVPFPPFIALTVVSILQRQRSPTRLGIQLGLLLAAQFLVLPEIFASVILFTIAAMLCVVIRYPANAATIVRTLARPVGIALALTAVVLAYPVWMMLAGPQHITGTTFPTVNSYHNDPVSFVVPGPFQKVSLGMRSLGNRLAAATGASEANGYIGIPVLILIAFFAWRSRRSGRMHLAMVLLLAAAVLSLGPHLAINGRLTAIPLPFLLLDHLPLLNDLLPSRISFETGAFLAAVIAFGLDDMHRVPDPVDADRPKRRSAVFAFVSLAVLVGTLLPEWPSPFVTGATAIPASVRRAVPGGDPVAITYPYPTEYTTQPMLWQAEDGFHFRLLGGYGYHPVRADFDPSVLLPKIMSPRGLQQFLAGQQSFALPTAWYGPPLPVSPALVKATRTTLSRYHVRVVIVGRSVTGSGPVMELFVDALGPPRLSTGQFSLWSGWHGVPRRQIFPNLVTKLARPKNGATVSGTQALDARVSDYLKVTEVGFYLTGPLHDHTLIGTGRQALFGWFTMWNTTDIGNGNYTLQAVAHDIAGRTIYGNSITITINNFQH